MRVVALLRRRRGARAALQPRLVARLALDAHPRAILRGSGAVATAAAPAFAGHAPATAIGLAGGMAPAARWFSWSTKAPTYLLSLNVAQRPRESVYGAQSTCVDNPRGIY